MPTIMESDLEFDLGGHRWSWSQLGEDRGSLLCLDPVLADDGTDASVWPSDEDISSRVGQTVRFFDAGDDPDYPEGIFILEVLAEPRCGVGKLPAPQLDRHPSRP